MDVVRLTRQLVDIDSTTGHELAVGEFLLQELRQLGFHAEAMPVEASRSNVVAKSAGNDKPQLFFSTHMDTVPPFIASSQDERNISGRGACDAKGIIAAQVAAALRLRSEGIAVGLLFTVGEERDSIGALEANKHSPRPRFLINGEPTENKLALASKGALRIELTAMGRMAHSAYPELGESAINKLIRALVRLLEMQLPVDPEIGASTLNIGIIEGGRAMNVIADFARAELLYRMVDDSTELKQQISAAIEGLCEARILLDTPAVRLRTLPGRPTMIASFTTDIPSLTNWGEPLLVGPGSIHVAHTEGEFIAKSELFAAIDVYCDLARRLLAIA